MFSVAAMFIQAADRHDQRKDAFAHDKQHQIDKFRICDRS